MPNFLDDLLNPAPASGAATPHMDGLQTDGADEATFAPELFQADPTDLAALAADATSTLENGFLGDTVNDAVVAPELKHETTDGLGQAISQYPEDGLGTMNSHDDDLMDVDSQQQGQSQDPSASPQAAKKPKARKRFDPEKDPRSSIHSSKNEGQHTDKRYLCYVCHKLFTRRRSVRDHMSKIHGSKAFEPTRSLEVTVDPISGEPTESLEDIIARGPPSSPEKAVKAPKKDKSSRPEETNDSSEKAPEFTDAPTGTNGDLDLGDFPEEQREALSDDLLKETKREKTPELVTKAEAAASPPPASSVSTATASVIPKKRPAPDTTKPIPASATKKGTARPKANTPVAKKPRLTEVESASDRSTPLRSPSATPMAASRLPTSKLKKQLSSASSPSSSRAASMDPASPSPSAAAETPGSSNDDGEVFCICRKGDNHTWMIACDGVCNEWYHGKCVNIRERDGDLIDKYICPACTKPDFMTTWKRMCRRQACRRPARVFDDPPSKYCSRECGLRFFVELVQRSDPTAEVSKDGLSIIDSTKPKKTRKKRKVEKRDRPLPRPHLNGDTIEDPDSRLATPAYSEDEKSEYETDSSADEEDLVNRGGGLRAGEIATLVQRCKTIDEWRALGRKPATPPPDDETEKAAMVYDDFERNKLREIEAQKEENLRRLDILEAREKLLEAIKTRSTSITDEVKKTNPKWKDVCGFDPRLAWNEDVFVQWYDKNGGKEILKSDKPRIGLPEEVRKPANGEVMANGVENDSDADSEDGKTTKKGGVCIRVRCTRHRNWAKSHLAEIRFEQDVVKRNMRQTEELEKGLQDRALLRSLESRA